LHSRTTKKENFYYRYSDAPWGGGEIVINDDDFGRVPFAIVAVLALVMANISVLYAISLNRETAENLAKGQELERMEYIGALSHREVEIEAHYICLQAIREGTQIYSNESKINEIFLENFEKYLQGNFPREVKDYLIEINDYQALVLIKQKETEDVVSTTRTAESTVNNTTFQEIDNSHPSEWNETSRLAYYVLLGYVNYTISSKDLSLKKAFKFSKDIESPFPLIEGSLEQMKMNAKGDSTDIGRMIKYILTTIAQYRALQGYAAGEYGIRNTTINDILTVKDLELSVNIAILLEEIRRFRSYDYASPLAFDEINYERFGGRFSNSTLSPSPSERTLKNLLEKFANGGTVDPADIFALYIILDSDVIHLNSVLAQAIAAIYDQYVMKYLDYFGLMGLADLTLSVIEWLANEIESVLEWLTGQNRQAEMVKSWVFDLFTDMGFGTFILNDSPILLPNLDFDVTNESGTHFIISVPSHSTYVDFDEVNLVSGHDNIWKDYYANIFQNDLKRVHSSVRDFVNDFSSTIAENINLIGAIPNPSLQGKIDPKDNTSILDYVEEKLRTSIKEALENLRSNPSYLKDLIGNVWETQKNLTSNLTSFLKTNYELFFNKGEQISLGKNRLQTHLFDKSKEDSDFSSLDSKAMNELNQSIVKEIEAGGWIDSAYNSTKDQDMTNLDSLYSIAAGMDTPPEQGGIYRRIQETVLDGTGLLARAGEIIQKFASEIVKSDDVSNAKFLIETPRSAFEFWDGNYEEAVKNGTARSERLRVIQNPAYLKVTKSSSFTDWDPLALKVGDLWVDLVDPSRFPMNKDSPNVHFTKPNETTQRPFEAQWDVHLLGLVEIQVQSQNFIFLADGTHLPTLGRESILLNVSFSIKVYSGWPLENVPYVSSDTFGEDLWNAIVQFLNKIWEGIMAFVDWIVDGVTKVIDFISNILGTLISYAMKIIEALSKAIQLVVELLQNALKSLVDFIGWVIDVIAAAYGPVSFTFSAFGLTFLVALNQGNGTRLNIGFEGYGLHLGVKFLKLEEANLSSEQRNRTSSRYDILSSWGFAIGDFSFDANIDPLMVIQSSILQGHGEWKDSWGIDVELPVIEVYIEKGYSFSFPTIPTPFGTLDIEAGFKIRLYEELERIDLKALFAKSFDETVEAMKNEPLSFEYVGKFIQTLIGRFIDNVIKAIESNLERIKEVILYIEGTFKAGAAAGGGIRLAFVAEGEAILHIFRWIMQNVLAFFNSLTNPNVEAEYYTLPKEVPEHLFIRGELFFVVGMPKLLVRAADAEEVLGDYKFVIAIQANVPVFGILLGYNWGRWRIDFGIYIESVPSFIANPIFGTGDAEPDVWILRASVYGV